MRVFGRLDGQREPTCPFVAPGQRHLERDRIGFDLCGSLQVDQGSMVVLEIAVGLSPEKVQREFKRSRIINGLKDFERLMRHLEFDIPLRLTQQSLEFFVTRVIHSESRRSAIRRNFDWFRIIDSGKKYRRAKFEAMAIFRGSLRRKLFTGTENSRL